MELSTSMGGLIPLWILGAPFVVGLILLITTPKQSRSEDRDDRDVRMPQAARPPLPATALGAQRL